MSKEDDYEFLQSFYIDTDGYNDRDRMMFVCGVEFEMIRQLFIELQERYHECARNIHTENSSRIRMMAGKMKIPGVSIEPCPKDLDPDGTWSYLYVGDYDDVDNIH